MDSWMRFLSKGLDSVLGKGFGFGFGLGCSVKVWIRFSLKELDLDFGFQGSILDSKTGFSKGSV
jgi:hypothetical protein